MPSIAALDGLRLVFPVPVTSVHRTRCLHLFMVLLLDHEVIRYMLELDGIPLTPVPLCLGLRSLPEIGLL